MCADDAHIHITLNPTPYSIAMVSAMLVGIYVCYTVFIDKQVLGSPV